MSGRFMRDGTYDPDPAWSFEPEQQERDLATIRAVADSLPREPAPEQPEDAHLDDYGSEWENGYDLNPIEQGMYDDDPDIYGGEYSEE